MSRIDEFDERRVCFPIDSIERMVNDFYADIRADEVLGPIFEERIHDWPGHLVRMVKFWRTVLRSEPIFTPLARGAPPQLHRQIPGIQREHYRRWLELFGLVAERCFGAVESRYVQECAHRIAASLSRHLPAEVGEPH